MDESRLSSEAPQEEAWKSTEDVQGVKKEENEEKFDELGDADDGVAGDTVGEFGGNKLMSDLSELSSIEAQSVTLNSVQFSENYLSSDFATSPLLLSEVPVDCGVLHSLELTEFKDQVEVSQLSTSLSVASESAQMHLHDQIQSSGCPTFSAAPSPTSVTESIFSASPAFPDQKLSSATKTDDTFLPEVEHQSSSKPKRIYSVNLVKTPSADGFNWRKYGQKQVKVPQGSRSYYRCTYSDCHVKKIERNDHLNNVIEVIYKGQHNHDPPQRTNSARECGSDEIVEVDVNEEHGDEPEAKRRLKKSQAKSSKKQKIVVHAAGDVGVSGDGYRWRKYGQKMVKGNPHPRNYYRCTSAGCPVRKHIEKAVDNTSGVILTYKGVHDHDMPVPKKGQCPLSPPLVAAAAPASMNSLQVEKKDEAVDNKLVPATQWSVDTGGEQLTIEAIDAGGDMTMEPTPTLLSVGFEIKQC